MDYSLKDAFKALKDINEDVEVKKLKDTSISEEDELADYRDHKNTLLREAIEVNIGDLEEVEDVKASIDNEKEESPIEQVVDPSATIVADLKGSYIGSAILQCPTCKTLIYKEVEKLAKSEEEPAEGEDILYNVGEECPHCGAVEGFELIGQVASLDVNPEEENGAEEESKEEEEVESEPLPTPEEEPVEEATETTEENVEVEESLDNQLDEGKSTQAVGNALNSHRDEWENFSNPEDMKKAVLNCLDKYKDDIPETEYNYAKMQFNKTNGNAFLGMLTSFITGMPMNKNKEHKQNVKDLQGEDLNEDLGDNEDKENFSYTFRVYGLDEDGDEDEFIEEFDSLEEAKEFALKQSCPTHIVYAPAFDPDDYGPEASNQGEYEDFEVVWSSINESFDDESFDECVNKFIRETYENVDSYKTTGGSITDEELIIEGIIKFKSGKEKLTSFVFTSNQEGLLEGLNETFSKENKFHLTYKMDKSNIITEKLDYIKE